MHSFKKALLVSAAFLLCVALLSGALAGMFFCSEARYDEDAHLRASLAGQLDLIVCGASHAQRSVIPAALDETLSRRSYNLSCAWANLTGLRMLLETEFSRNDISDVILVVSYETLVRDEMTDGYEGDQHILPQLYNTDQILSYAKACMTPSDVLDTFACYVKEGLSLVPAALLGRAHEVIYENRGYRPTGTEDVTLPPRAILQKYRAESIDLAFREENLRQLEEILALCGQNSAEVLIVTAPVSENMLWRHTGWDDFHAEVKRVAQEHGLSYLDFNLLRTRFDFLSDDVSYFNTTHLSAVGAERFTPAFAEILRRYYAGEDVSDAFYDNYEQMLDDSAYMAYYREHAEG